MVEWHEDERLADWFDGNLGARERERFEAEMAVNPELKRAAEDYAAATERIRAALRAGTESPPGITDRIMAEIDGGARSRRAPLPIFGSLAAAAAIVLVFLGISQLGDEAPPSVERTARTDAGAADESPDGSVESKAADAPGAKRAEGAAGTLNTLDEEAAEEAEEVAPAERPTPGRAAGREIAAPGAPQTAAADDDAADFDVALAAGDEAGTLEPVIVLELVPDADTALGLADESDAAKQRLADPVAFLRTPIVATEWASVDGPPTLGVRRVAALGEADGKDRVTRSAVEESVKKSAKQSAKKDEKKSAKQSAKKDEKKVETRTLTQPVAEPIFELRGTREQIGEYVRKLGDLARQNRARVRTLAPAEGAAARDRARELGAFDPIVDPVVDKNADGPAAARRGRVAGDTRVQRVWIVVRPTRAR